MSAMKISTRGRYAVRVMLDLALHDHGECVKVKQIADRQKLSEKYLEQIISVLNKAGFVRSIRGPQGGYVLQKRPEDYTVGMILRLTEGSLAPVECLADNALPCDRSGKCATVEIYRRIYDAVNQVIDNTTLQDLLDIEARKAANDYVI